MSRPSQFESFDLKFVSTNRDLLWRIVFKFIPWQCHSQVSQSQSFKIDSNFVGRNRGLLSQIFLTFILWQCHSQVSDCSDVLMACISMYWWVDGLCSDVFMSWWLVGDGHTSHPYMPVVCHLSILRLSYKCLYWFISRCVLVGPHAGSFI